MEKYIYVADGNTACKKCSKNNGDTYANKSEFPTLPIHPFCRCKIIKLKEFDEKVLELKKDIKNIKNIINELEKDKSLIELERKELKEEHAKISLEIAKYSNKAAIDGYSGASEYLDKLPSYGKLGDAIDKAKIFGSISGYVGVKYEFYKEYKAKLEELKSEILECDRRIIKVENDIDKYNELLSNYVSRLEEINSQD